MDSKILRKWGLKAVDSKDSLPGSPVSQSSRDTQSGTFFDAKGLQAWLPPIPPFERQRLSADVLQDLRYACAAILKDTTPDEAELDQTDPLEEYKKAIVRAEKHENPKEAVVEQKTQKPRKDSPRASGFHQPSTQTNHIGSVASHANGGDSSSKDKHGLDTVPGFPQPPKREPYKSASLTNKEHYKSLPDKAAYLDYVVAKGSSRTSAASPGPSTVRSARDTTVASLSQPYRDTQNGSNGRSIEHPSAQGVHHEDLPIRPGSSSHVNASHNVWVTGGRTQREHEEAVAPPVLRKSESRSSLMSQNGLRSRAENIRDGIKGYIRPGSSRGSLSRPGTSQSNEQPAFAPIAAASRPESRGSFSADNKRSWWKAGGLRRKGSYTASRNSMGSNPGYEAASPSRDSGPDLDKSLPPMPSLDSWVEPPKETKLHISQLMVPVVPSTSPSVPQNSLASPTNPVLSPTGLKSPSSFHTAQNSPRGPQTPQHARAPPRNKTSHSVHSPALTPGGGSAPQPHRSDQQPQSSNPQAQTTSRRRPDTNRPEPGYSTEQPVNHSWRENLLQQEAERRIKRERARQLAKEQRSRMLEAQEKQGGNMVRAGKEKESASLKNRLSRMFGHKPSGRSHTTPTTDSVAETTEPMEERSTGREIIAN